MDSYSNTYIHACIHTYIHAYIYIHMHLCNYVCILVVWVGTLACFWYMLSLILSVPTPLPGWLQSAAPPLGHPPAPWCSPFPYHHWPSLMYTRFSPGAIARRERWMPFRPGAAGLWICPFHRKVQSVGDPNIFQDNVSCVWLPSAFSVRQTRPRISPGHSSLVRNGVTILDQNFRSANCCSASPSASSPSSSHAPLLDVNRRGASQAWSWWHGSALQKRIVCSNAAWDWRSNRTRQVNSILSCKPYIPLKTKLECGFGFAWWWPVWPPPRQSHSNWGNTCKYAETQLECGAKIGKKM